VKNHGAITPYQSAHPAGQWSHSIRHSDYGREQATAGKKQRQIYPNGPVFGDGSATTRSGNGQRAPARIFLLDAFAAVAQGNAGPK
jgi:hypothetical protein